MADGLFYGDEELTSIDIADSVEYIGSMAFEECINLRAVSYTHLDVYKRQDVFAVKPREFIVVKYSG